MPDQVLERFHRALIEEIQTQRPEYLTQPFTVAEIYQNLVPYGSHRDRIGVEMNGDYEDALVRLLAGEGGYLILDSEPALKKLRAALDAPNPNSGVYRDFAAVDVRLNQAYLDLSAEALDQFPDLVEELEAEDPVTMTDLAPAEGNATANELGLVPPGVDIFAEGAGPADVGADVGADVEGEGAEPVETPSAALDEGLAPTDAALNGELPSSVDAADGESPHAADGESPSVHDASDDAGSTSSGAPAPDDRVASEDEGAESSEASAATKRRPPLEPEYVETESDEDASGEATGSSCVWCRADLPERGDLNYCPFCGTDVRLVPCASCGAEVEPGWRFCVTCGAEVEE